LANNQSFRLHTW